MPLKMLYGTEVKPAHHSLEISRAGNVVMVIIWGIWLINVVIYVGS